MNRKVEHSRTTGRKRQQYMAVDFTWDSGPSGATPGLFKVGKRDPFLGSGCSGMGIQQHDWNVSAAELRVSSDTWMIGAACYGNLP